MSDIDDFLDKLIEVPIHKEHGTDRSQIDETIVEELRKVRAEPDNAKRLPMMKQILNDSACCALASDFGMTAMGLCYDMMKGSKKEYL